MIMTRERMTEIGEFAWYPKGTHKIVRECLVEIDELQSALIKVESELLDVDMEVPSYITKLLVGVREE